MRGIDIEFLQTESGLCTYLHVHNPLVAEAKIQIDALTCVAPTRQGQQRVQLPAAFQELLISHLKEGKAVTITLNGHRETIKADDFEKMLEFRSSSLLNLKLL